MDNSTHYPPNKPVGDSSAAQVSEQVHHHKFNSVSKAE